MFESVGLHIGARVAPLTTLVASDVFFGNDIRNFRKVKNVLVPHAGHWARFVAGKDELQVPLITN